MKRFVVIVAGGIGNRMKSDMPKQFLPIKGKPILLHSLEAFYNYDKEIRIILVLPGESKAYWEEIKQKNKLPYQVTLAKGGNTRSDSVRSGLEFVPENSLVAIHDAARPLVSRDLIDRCFSTAEQLGNSCPCITPSDSMRIKNDAGSGTVNRALYYLVQTPQCFQSSLIKAAFAKTMNTEFTDETSLLEHTGQEIHLIEGDRWNVKITYPEDLLIAEALAQN